MEPVQETSSWRKKPNRFWFPSPQRGREVRGEGRAHHGMSSQVFRDPYRSRVSWNHLETVRLTLSRAALQPKSVPRAQEIPDLTR